MIKKNVLNKIILFFLVTVLLAATYILYLNFKSLKVQRIVKQEATSGKLTSTSKTIVSSYPNIPNLTVLAEPIAVQKARYLLSEGKHKVARKLLKEDNSNPFDGRKEFFLAQSYYEQKQYDSAVFYSEKSYYIKPRFIPNIKLLASSYEKNGQIKEALKIYEKNLTYLKGGKFWRITATLNEKLGNLERAEKYIDSALVYYPRRIKLHDFKNRIMLKTKVPVEYRDIYKKAAEMFDEKNYKQTLVLLNSFIEKYPNYPNAYYLSAYCYYYEKEYQKSLQSINKLEQLNIGKLIAKLINLKGVNYFALGQKAEACKYFKQARNMRDKDGISNFEKICK